MDIYASPIAYTDAVLKGADLWTSRFSALKSSVLQGGFHQNLLFTIIDSDYNTNNDYIVVAADAGLSTVYRRIIISLSPAYRRFIVALSRNRYALCIDHRKMRVGKWRKNEKAIDHGSSPLLLFNCHSHLPARHCILGCRLWCYGCWMTETLTN